MRRPDKSCVLSICLLLICMTCQLEQQPSANVTSTQEGNNTCMPGYFGRACGSKCPNACSQTCDNRGHCTACSRTGVRLPNCTTECPIGFYGLHCKNRCLECRNSACNPQSGECRKCRFPGLRLPLCTSPCLHGTFGMDCKSRCPLPCRHTCDLVTGDCLQCEYGQGPRCLVNCASEQYTEACQRYCLGRCLTWCNSSDGMCSICTPGHKAPYCRDPCDDGHFGHNCAEKCSSRCQDGRCDPTTGVCYACRAGYVGERCNGQCISGFFGAGCTSSCPPTCAGGLCNFTTGDCTRCNPGYTGLGCDQFCDEGKFGEGCQLDCPMTCGGKCDPVSGECWLCLPGYVGIFCNESCRRGTHGPGCASLCPVGCLNRMCNHVTGACLACQEHLHGQSCDLSEVAGSTSVHVLTIISLLMTFIVLILLVSVICFRRKMRRSHTEQSDPPEVNQPTKEIANQGSLRDKRLIPATTQPESAAGTCTRRALDPLPGHSKDLQRPRLLARHGRVFLPRAPPSHVPLNSDPVVLSLRPSLRSAKELAGKELDSQGRQNIEKQFAGVLKHRLQGVAAHPSTSSAIDSNRFGKRLGQMTWYTGKRLINKESVMDLPKLSNLPYIRGERCSFSPEGTTGSMRGESSKATPGRNEFRSDGKSGRETKITLFEHTECLSGKTTVSTGWSVNLPPYTPLVPSHKTPEMVIAKSRDSFFTGRIVSSADSLFGLTSADLSREMSNISRRNSQLLGMEQTRQLKNAPPCQQLATKSIMPSTSHIFSDKNTGTTQRSSLLRRPPSVYSLPETILSTHLTCATRPGQTHCDINSKVHSDGRLTKTDPRSGRRNLITKHEISITDQLGSDVRKPGSLSEGTRISCVSERSVVVSDGGRSARRTSHGDKPRSSDLQTGHSGLFYNSLSQDGPGHREQSTVPGDETLPHSETNSWLNEDQDDTAACCEVSSHIKVNDPRPTFSEVMLPETLPLTRNYVGSSSHHGVPSLNSNMTPPKRLVQPHVSRDERLVQPHVSHDERLVQPHVSRDEDTHNDSEAVTFQNRSEKLTSMPFTDRVTAADSAVQGPDDLLVRSVVTTVGASSRRTTRCRLPGDNASPKLIRCSTTRQVSPMYSYNTAQAGSRLQPLPTPPPEGIKALRPIRKQSMSSSSSESQLPDLDPTNQKHYS